MIRKAYHEEWYNLLLLILPFLMMPFIWDQLPIVGQWWYTNTYIIKQPVTIYAVPLVSSFVYLTLLSIGEIQLQKTSSKRTLLVLRTALLLVFLGLFIWLGTKWGSNSFTPGSTVYLALAVIFLFSGMYLQRAPFKSLFGIRVPWALNNKQNWINTHSFGSQVWIGGSLLMISFFLPTSLSIYVLLANLILAAMIQLPIAYSYLQYKRKFNTNSE